MHTWDLGRGHAPLFVAGVAVLVAVPLVGLMVVLAWRLMLSARATRMPSMGGTSKEEGGRFRLRRPSRLAGCGA